MPSKVPSTPSSLRDWRPTRASSRKVRSATSNEATLMRLVESLLAVAEVPAKFFE